MGGGITVGVAATFLNAGSANAVDGLCATNASSCKGDAHICETVEHSGLWYTCYNDAIIEVHYSPNSSGRTGGFRSPSGTRHRRRYIIRSNDIRIRTGASLKPAEAIVISVVNTVGRIGHVRVRVVLSAATFAFFGCASTPKSDASYARIASNLAPNGHSIIILFDIVDCNLSTLDIEAINRASAHVRIEGVMLSPPKRGADRDYLIGLLAPRFPLVDDDGSLDQAVMRDNLELPVLIEVRNGAIVERASGSAAYRVLSSVSGDVGHA